MRPNFSEIVLALRDSKQLIKLYQVWFNFVLILIFLKLLAITLALFDQSFEIQEKITKTRDPVNNLVRRSREHVAEFCESSLNVASENFLPSLLPASVRDNLPKMVQKAVEKENLGDKSEKTQKRSPPTEKPEEVTKILSELKLDTYATIIKSVCASMRTPKGTACSMKIVKFLTAITNGLVENVWVLRQVAHKNQKFADFVEEEAAAVCLTLVNTYQSQKQRARASSHERSPANLLRKFAVQKPSDSLSMNPRTKSNDLHENDSPPEKDRSDTSSTSSPSPAATKSYSRSISGKSLNNRNSEIVKPGNNANVEFQRKETPIERLCILEKSHSDFQKPSRLFYKKQKVGITAKDRDDEKREKEDVRRVEILDVGEYEKRRGREDIEEKEREKSRECLQQKSREFLRDSEKSRQNSRDLEKPRDLAKDMEKPKSRSRALSRSRSRDRSEIKKVCVREETPQEVEEKKSVRQQKSRKDVKYGESPPKRSRSKSKGSDGKLVSSNPSPNSQLGTNKTKDHKEDQPEQQTKQEQAKQDQLDRQRHQPDSQDQPNQNGGSHDYNNQELNLQESPHQQTMKTLEDIRQQLKLLIIAMSSTHKLARDTATTSHEKLLDILQISKTLKASPSEIIHGTIEETIRARIELTIGEFLTPAVINFVNLGTKLNSQTFADFEEYYNTAIGYIKQLVMDLRFL